MVHLEKFKVKGNLYYKLVHNVRKEGKVKSISRYIGKVLPEEEKLNSMKEKFYQEVLEKRKNKGAENASKKQKTLTNDWDDLPTGILQTSKKSLEIVQINKAAILITGYKKLDFAKDKLLFSKLIYEEDKELVFKKILESRNKKEPAILTFRIINKFKDIVWINFAISWKNDSMLASIDNVTNVKESEEQYYRLFEYSPTGLIVLDYSAIKQYLNELKLTGDQLRRHIIENPKIIKNISKMVKVKKVNKSALNLFEAKGEEGFRLLYQQQFARDSNEVFFEELIAISQNYKEFESPIFIFSMAGRRRQVQMTWTVPLAHSKKYSQVLVSFVDTTLQRKMAETMQIKNSAIEYSKSAIMITDLEGKITYANYSFIELLNIDDMGNLIGDRADKYLTSKEGGLKVLQIMHTKKGWQGIVKIQKESRTKFLDVQGIFVNDEYHGALGMVFSFVDITEHKMTEKIRLDFTNIAAHELKTPLTPLKTFVSMMLDNPKQFGLNQDGIKNLQVCLRNVKKLSQLIGDILDISKLEAGGMKFNMVQSDLLTILNQEFEDFVQVAKDKMVILKKNLPKSLPLILIDKARIAQVIGNLIRNSIQYTEEGNIQISAKLAEKDIIIKIVDTGLGIAEEDQKKLFTKFFQAADVTTRKVGGTGLGLAISKEIIEAHSGKIWASSQGIGKGTTFWISLPFNHKKAIKKNQNKRKTKILPSIDSAVLSNSPEEVKGGGDRNKKVKRVVVGNHIMQ